MAILTSSNLEKIRQALAKELDARWTKVKINAAIQAVEDTFLSPAVQGAISNAINTATDPLVLTAAEKKALVKYWLLNKYERGN